MMKRFTIALLLFFTVWGCSKDDIEVSESLIKVVPNTRNYMARRVIDHSNGQTYVFSIGAEDVSQSGPYGGFPSMISTYTSERGFISSNPLPNSVYELWDAMELDDGRLLIIGRDDTRLSNQTGLVILSPEGNLEHQYSFENTSTVNSLLNSAITGNGMDCIQLEDGSIVLGCFLMLSQFESRRLRLLKFDTSLNLIEDVNHFISYEGEELNISELSLEANAKGFSALCYSPLTLTSQGDTADVFVSNSVQLNLDLQIESQGHVLSEEFGIARGHAQADDHEMVWTFTPKIPIDPEITPTLNLRNQERYSYGPRTFVYKSNISGDLIDETLLSDFPKNGVIHSMQKCSDGGYVLVGTVNLNQDLSVPSFQSLYVAKLSSALDILWTEHFNFNQPTYGAHIVESNSGFSICATTYTNQNLSQVILIKMNNQGQII